MSDTVDALVRRHSAMQPSTAMVVDPQRRLSYAELDFRSLEVAARLVRAGINKGSRVGLLAPNGVDWVLTAVAVMRIGAVLVPLSTLLRPAELRDQLRTAAIQYLIAVEEFRGNHPLADLELSPALRQVWTPQQVDLLPGGDIELAEALTHTVRPADTMVIIFTSGSSGAPKGVLHSHGNALSAVASGLGARCVTADTRLYLPMPFFWVGGFGSGILTALVAGATLVTEPVPAPESTLRLLERERVTLFRGWPDQAAALAAHAGAADLTSLRPGSLDALLPEGQRARAGARANLFGMTETFGPYCGYPADTDMPRLAWGSCGKPFAGMEIRIVDPDTGVEVPTGTTGVIHLRGPQVMRGICRRSREDTFTVDGFYDTGDLGHLDTDGFLFHHGRVDDMFKVSGATVYPIEVERVLRAIPGVHAAFVTNVGAAVVCRGHTAESLRAAAKAHLSAFKVPTTWLLLDDNAVPRLPSGKVDNAALRHTIARSRRPATSDGV